MVDQQTGTIMVSIEALKQITLVSCNGYSDVSSGLSTTPGNRKTFCFEETEVTRLVSWFLAVSHSVQNSHVTPFLDSALPRFYLSVNSV